MKKRVSRIVATAAALALSCTMMAANAATVSITKVETLNADNTVKETITLGTTADAADLPRLTSEDLVRVTLTWSGNEGESADQREATFLSHVADAAAADLSNANIQYVDQQTTGAGGAATVTFRPRATTVPDGVYVMKAGGTDVASPAVGYYTTEEAKVTPSMGDAEDITLGSSENAVFTITNYNDAWAGAVGLGVFVSENENALSSENYTLSGSNNSGTLTIQNSVFITAGTYTVTLKGAEGYDSVEARVTVKAKEIPEDPEIQNVLNKVELSGYSLTEEDSYITLPDKTDVTALNADGYAIAWEVTGADDTNVTYEEETRKITYEHALGDEVFSKIVTVTPKVVNNNKKYSGNTMSIYIMRPDAAISFGNVTALGYQGQDALSSDEIFAEYKESAEAAGSINLAKAKALNIALKRERESTIAGGADTLDYNYDGEVTLSEYRIFSLMVNGVQNFSIGEVKSMRPENGNN